MEMITGRTLAFEGEKKITAVAQRLNALQHSLTIQPVISCDGDIVEPTLVVFAVEKEPRKFQEELAEFENLYCKSRPSGLCDVKIEKEWFRDVMVPKSEPGSLLLLDSWGGFNQALEDNIVKEHLLIERIPKKCTSRIQALVKYWNRPYKNFYRRLCDKVRLKYSAH
uniref:DDE-1 domain-containing protein n=1 Tax=Acrobeloides nanus TaxID=290746 RepID=A0A914DH63_9BILA